MDIPLALLKHIMAQKIGSAAPDLKSTSRWRRPEFWTQPRVRLCESEFATETADIECP